jgi:hypothetical protein
MVLAAISVVASTIGLPLPAAAHPAAAAPTPTIAAGSLGIRLLDVPVESANDPRARNYIVDSMRPGSTIERRVEVSNTTGTVLDVSLYPDAAHIDDGAFTGEAGHGVNELTTWTSVAATTLDIPAGGVVQATVTIAVPSDAPPGEQYAFVWAEASSGGGSGVALVARVGIRLYISVSGDNPPASNFTVDTMTGARNAAGQAVVTALVHNTGGRALDMSGTLTMSTVNGNLTAGPYDAELGTSLAPGQSEPVTIILTDDLVAGPWDASLALRSGIVTGTFDARLTFPAGPGSSAPVPAVSASAPPAWLVGVLALVAALLLAAVIVLLIALRRRRNWAHPLTSTRTKTR